MKEILAMSNNDIEKIGSSMHYRIRKYQKVNEGLFNRRGGEEHSKWSSVDSKKSSLNTTLL